ncbi:MAG TPA: hypothetical protein VGP70_13095 [Actinomadura sp.]|nr:hypothetical protein [Actinomadura sp.]
MDRAVLEPVPGGRRGQHVTGLAVPGVHFTGPGGGTGPGGAGLRKVAFRQAFD